MRARSGMTLMELVIGLAITGMMAAAGAAAFSSIIDHKRVIHEASATTERASALRETIRGWAQSGQVRVQLGGGPRLTSAPGGATAGRGGTSSLGGLSVAAVTPAQAIGDELIIGNVTAPNPAFQSGIVIRLYVDGDANTPEHGLTIEYRPNQTQGLVRKMVDSTIDSLRVEYLDGRMGRWVAASQGAAVSNMRAVRATLVPNPKIPFSPILLEPMLFTIGTQGMEVTVNNRGR
jgi:prepilin-type N-terminal cleavage/methylation domain-containing protein